MGKIDELAARNAVVVVRHCDDETPPDYWRLAPGRDGEIDFAVVETLDDALGPIDALWSRNDGGSFPADTVDETGGQLELDTSGGPKEPSTAMLVELEEDDIRSLFGD